MELTESRDRWLKKTSEYERFNNLPESSSTEERAPFIPELPASRSKKKNGLFLDLNNSDARWLVAAARKKYIPVGVSKNFELASLSLINLQQSKVAGYIVVAEQNDLPFQQDLFDLVWSHSPYEFSSLHHLPTFTENLRRVLAKSGIAKIALRKKYSTARENGNGNALNGTNGHHVSFTQLKKEFGKHLTNVHCTIQKCFGFPSEKQSDSSNKKTTIITTSTIEWCSRWVQSLNHLSESVYINARKNSGSPNFRIHHFMKHHWLKQNLNVVYLLQCPISGGPVYLSKDANFVVSDLANVKYPVVNDIPIMLKKAAVDLDSNKTAREALRLLQA